MSAGRYAFLTAFCHRFLLQPGATMLRLDVCSTSINGLRGAAVVKQIAANWVFLKVWQPQDAALTSISPVCFLLNKLDRHEGVSPVGANVVTPQVELINALYFATYQLKRPRGWSDALPIGRYWRSALALFFNYGLDTGTIWKSTRIHEPILWRHITWDKYAPDGRQKDSCRWGWIYFRRVKTGKTFYRPMNRVVHEHIRNIMPQSPEPNDPVFLGGGCRPNATFVTLCQLAGIRPKLDIETGQQVPWHVKDLRKTCATYYDEHIPESSIEILGHAVGGITYRHYAHRDPLAFRAIMTIPQPSAFLALVKGHDGECPCCRRPFVTAD